MAESDTARIHRYLGEQVGLAREAGICLIAFHVGDVRDAVDLREKDAPDTLIKWALETKSKLPREAGVRFLFQTGLGYDAVYVFYVLANPLGSDDSP